MGCGQSSSASLSSPEEKRRNDQIDAELKQARMEMKQEVKMLLLGAGESGKSTLVKQMRLLYAAPYSTDERNSYREVVFSNALQSMQAVIRGFAQLEVPIPSHLTSEADYLLSLQTPADDDSGIMYPQAAQAIIQLWADPATKDVVAQSNQYQLNDSASYFFEELPRIAKEGYLPTDQDILRTRVRSTGITEEKFKVRQYILRVFDVGGQRSERKKWIHCFENVSVLIFVASVSEYDSMLWEDNSVNRMDEATMLFDSIASSRWFEKSSFVLMLNKVDLLADKIHRSPLVDYFPEYTGGTSLESAKSFIKHKFESLHQRKDRQIYTHFTCATDTSQIQVILAAMMDSLLTSMLSEVGLM